MDTFLEEPIESWVRLRYLIKSKNFRSIDEFSDTLANEEFETAKLISKLTLAEGKLDAIYKILDTI